MRGPSPKSVDELKTVVSRVKFPGLLLEVDMELGQPWLRVEDPSGTCNVSGASHPWKGRKWRLSTFMTAGEIVQTAFKAVMTALEHEARERFLYKDVAVLGPHLDIDKLVDFIQDGGTLERAR